jgi:hypothetical protein
VWQKSGIVEMLRRALDLCNTDHEAGCKQALKVLPFHKTVMSRMEQTPSNRRQSQVDNSPAPGPSEAPPPGTNGVRITVTNGTPVCTIAPANIVVRSSHPVDLDSSGGAHGASHLHSPSASGADAARRDGLSTQPPGADGLDEPGLAGLVRRSSDGIVMPFPRIVIAQPTTGVRPPYQPSRSNLPIAPLFGRPTITSSQSGPPTAPRVESRRVDTRSLSSPGRLTTSGGFFGPSVMTFSAAADRAVAAADSPSPVKAAAVGPSRNQSGQTEAPVKREPLNDVSPIKPVPAEGVVSPRGGPAAVMEDLAELPKPVSAFASLERRSSKEQFPEAEAAQESSEVGATESWVVAKVRIAESVG